MTTHDLKVWPEFFEALCTGDKTFELRKDDRDFKVGDWLKLREWRPASIATATPAAYTGQRVMRQISYVLEANDVSDFGSLHESYVILALAPPLVELGCRLQGKRMFLESTKPKDAADATDYLVRLMRFVEQVRAHTPKKKAPEQTANVDGRR